MAFKEKYKISEEYLTAPSRRRRGIALSPGVKFIVAHDTGNPTSTARNNKNYYERSRDEKSASAHIFVDDKEIIECIPALTSNKPEKAWHVLYNVPNDNDLFGYNANDVAIGVEYCYGSNINADEAYRKYIWVMAKICYKYDLDPSKSIVGHCFLDPVRKTDPVTGLLQSRRTYEQLLKDVVTEYNECIGEPVDEAKLVEEKGAITSRARLNIRVGRPNTKAPVARILDANSVVNYTHYTVNGEPVNGNSKWYRDEANNYYWSGGFDLINATTLDADESVVQVVGQTQEVFSDTPAKFTEPVSLNLALEVDNNVKNSLGRNVTVGILDNPVLSLEKHFQNRVSYIQDGGAIQDSHGLRVASIIGSNTDVGSSGIIGIAPQCSLLSMPIFINGNFAKEYVIDAINKAILRCQRTKELIVFNLSFSVVSVELVNALSESIDKLSDLFLVIASAGQDRELLVGKALQWPSRLQSVVSVGAVSKEFLKENPNAQFNDDLDILMPDLTYPTHSLNSPSGFATIKKDSAAAAAISAISALIISRNGILTKAQLLSYLYGMSIGYSELSGEFSFKPINPKK